MSTLTRTRYITNARRFYRYPTSITYTQLRITRTIPDHIHYTNLIPPSPAKDKAPAEVKTFSKTDIRQIQQLAIAGLDVLEGVAEACVDLYAGLDYNVEANRKDLLVILNSQQTHASLGRLAKVAAPGFSVEAAATAFRAEVGRVALSEGDTTSVELWTSLFISNLINPTIDEMTNRKILKSQLRRTVRCDRRRFSSWRDKATAQQTTNSQPSSSLPLKRSSNDAFTAKSKEQSASTPLAPKDIDSSPTESDRPQILGRSRKANSSIFIPSEQSLRIGHRYPGAPTEPIDNMWLQTPSSGSETESSVKRAKKRI